MNLHQQKEEVPSDLAPPRIGFGTVLLERVRSISPDSVPEHFTPEAFLSGAEVVKGRNGEAVLTRVLPVTREDGTQILSWYEPDTSDQPTYADDPRWKEWWSDAIAGKFEGMEVKKLCLANSDTVLAFIALKVVNDWLDNGAPTLYLNGLRINPNLMPKDHGARLYSGTGSALISHAIIQSFDQGLSGIGLNSSQGVEGFYRSLGLEEKISFDGKRTYFFLKGREKLLSYIEKRYLSSMEALRSEERGR